MAESGMTLQVSQDLVKPVIEAKIQAAIVAELLRQDQAGLMEMVVGQSLTAKVNEDGKATNDYYAKTPYIEWLCQRVVRDQAKKAIESWVEKNGETIQKQLESQFAKHSKTLAASFVEGLLKSVKSQWNFKCDVAFESLKDR